MFHTLKLKLKITVLISESAFPGISSLRYTDDDTKKQHHILCRDKNFMEPEGGWFKEGRFYLAVCDSSGELVY